MQSVKFRPTEVTRRRNRLRPVFSIAAILMTALITITVLFHIRGNEYSKYEEAYFKARYEESMENSYSFFAIGLYNRLFLFPQDKSWINLFIGSSISWNNWQFETGLRPLTTKNFCMEIQLNYIIHHGRVRTFEFNPFGDVKWDYEKQYLDNFFFGVNFQFYIK